MICVEGCSICGAAAGTPCLADCEALRAMIEEAQVALVVEESQNEVEELEPGPLDLDREVAVGLNALPEELTGISGDAVKDITLCAAATLVVVASAEMQQRSTVDSEP